MRDVLRTVDRYPASVPDSDPPGPYTAIAGTFGAHRARQALQLAQTRAWTGIEGAEELGTFDSVSPLEAGEVSNVYARLAALSVQRLRVLSDQLSRAYTEHGTAAFVRDRLIYNPATQEVEVAGEEPTALAKLELEERKLLQNLLTSAVRLKLEAQSQAARDNHGRRMAAFAQSLCELAGLDWAAEDTRRLAQRAILVAEAEVSRATA